MPGPKDIWYKQGLVSALSGTENLVCATVRLKGTRETDLLSPQTRVK